MFEQPAKKDIDAALSILMHEARRKTLDEKNRITSDAIKAGALGGNRIIVAVAAEADKAHKASIDAAKNILLDFIQRMQLPATQITAWARPHLENLSNSVLGVIPPNNFPDDYRRIVSQYTAIFQQRVDLALREVEIGYAKGIGFAQAEQMQNEDLWIRAADASRLLKPVFNGEYIARMTICKRAHNGLIRARAERYMVVKQASDNQEVPKEFWWAEGGEALQQNWTTGDFETWIRQEIRLQAFGVSFLRGDIEKMIPATPSEQGSAAASKATRRAIILTALHIETRAVLRHLSDVREETVRGTVFHVGRFDEWLVAVAECGEGNVHAAATVERGIAHYKPHVALFVGVAGGIKDVSIGDALVASKVYGYERGKDTGEDFKPRPVVDLPAYALDQRARSIKLKADWQRRLDTNLLHTNPSLYIGAIAAGEKVVSSSSGRVAQFLKDTYGDALGVEMEGHGFLGGVHINAPVQGCVVRGISDLLDGKAEADKAGSQEKAADVASAVAYEMLATLPPAALD